MIAGLIEWRDRLLGRGAASVTVPPLDGALKPNSRLEEAPPGLAFPAPDNAAVHRGRLVFSSGANIMGRDGVQVTLDSRINAMLSSPSGDRRAVACKDGTLRLFGHDLQAAPDVLRGVSCATAIAFADAETLVVASGSSLYSLDDWQRDLLTEGCTGSLWKIPLAGGEARQIAGDLAFPYGVLCEPDGTFIVAESWRKRLVRLNARGAILGQPLEDLPGFPARIMRSAAPGVAQGYWLAIFAPRNQLIEFVLREPGYRRAMMEEVEPEYWVSPALSSGHSFFEPMQGGALKQMGILKPWAPTRSYGLVVELNAEFVPVRSFHSRAGGRRHGVTSAMEHDGRLWVTSKGGDEVVAIAVRE